MCDVIKQNESELANTDFKICDQTRVNEADVVSWPISDFVSNAFSTSLGSFWHQHYKFITFPSRVMINFIFVFWSTLFLKIQFTGS